jgi:rubredoxin
VIEVASRLNGEEADFHTSVRLLAQYQQLLFNDGEEATCPDCGTDLQRWMQTHHGSTELARGKWRCPSCETTHEIRDVLEVADRNNSTVPRLPARD